MILDILDSYTEIIAGYDIIKFKVVSTSYQIMCRIDFLDQSQLYMRDFLFLEYKKIFISLAECCGPLYCKMG